MVDLNIMPVKLHFSMISSPKKSLLDINYLGFDFTWFNGRSGSASRWARLDRCLVNAIWTAFYNNYFITHLPRICSNHSPLFLNALAQAHTRNFVFCFGITG